MPFGRYRLEELLGRGGMGEVWRAYDPVMHRMVALKVLPPNFAGDHVFEERFRREARSAAGLDEPHVVPIYDFGEIEGRLYVTMKLIRGKDLQQLLDDGPLEPARAVGIISQIASALHAAHEVKLVHRDVKPSNILVADDDFAYLIDFGIARAAGETGLTSTGATIGTWAYMAPERFRTGKADARSDIYALACVLHQALTGQPPFPVNSLEQVAVAHMVEPPPAASPLREGIPQAIDQVITTGMAKDPDDRYSTTKELAEAARAALSAPIRPPRPPTAPTARVEPVIQPAPAFEKQSLDRPMAGQPGRSGGTHSTATGITGAAATRPAPAVHQRANPIPNAAAEADAARYTSAAIPHAAKQDPVGPDCRHRCSHRRNRRRNRDRSHARPRQRKHARHQLQLPSKLQLLPGRAELLLSVSELLSLALGRVH